MLTITVLHGITTHAQHTRKNSIPVCLVLDVEFDPVSLVRCIPLCLSFLCSILCPFRLTWHRFLMTWSFSPILSSRQASSHITPAMELPLLEYCVRSNMLYTFELNGTPTGWQFCVLCKLHVHTSRWRLLQDSRALDSNKPYMNMDYFFHFV